MGEGQYTSQASRGASPFWAFSLKIYSSPTVPPACLTLQDGSGVDVNVMLFCMFLAGAGRRISVGDGAVIEASVEDWRVSAVVPLRHVRRFLTEPPEAFRDAATALRDRIKAVELEAERLQQEALYGLRPPTDWGEPDAVSRATARHNIAAYEHLIGKPFDRNAVAALLNEFEGRYVKPGAPT